MAYICSKDPSHQSEDSDYCSICGAKIIGAAGLAAAPARPSPAPAAVNTSGNLTECPDCHTKRTSNARFCEVCRYDFERQAPSPTAPPPTLAPQPTAAPLDSAPAPAPWPAPLDEAAQIQAPPGIPIAAVAPPIAAPTVAAPDAAPVAAGVGKWEATVVVDPTLYTDPDPDIALPTNEPERVFPLDFAENLLGRRSDRKDIHPEIPVGDPGVSHRHAKILRQPDGSFILLDVGSTNGTRLNDVDVLPGVRTPLHDGDQITVGCWTRITIRRKVAGQPVVPVSP